MTLSENMKFLCTTFLIEMIKNLIVWLQYRVCQTNKMREMSNRIWNTSKSHQNQKNDKFLYTFDDFSIGFFYYRALYIVVSAQIWWGGEIFGSLVWFFLFYWKSSLKEFKLCEILGYLSAIFWVIFKYLLTTFLPKYEKILNLPNFGKPIFLAFGKIRLILCQNMLSTRFDVLKVSVYHRSSVNKVYPVITRDFFRSFIAKFSSFLSKKS